MGNIHSELINNMSTLTSTTRPTLGTGDVGKSYFETDSNKVLVWDGTGWNEWNTDLVLTPGFNNNNSVDLAGDDDIVTCGNIASINSASNVSISCWVKADTFPGSTFNSLWGGGNTGGNATGRFWLTANSGRFNIYNGGTQNFSFTTTVSTGTWYHVVAVVSGSSNFTLYVNGSQVGGTVTTFTSLTSVSGNNFQMGGNPTYDPYFWDGLIDEFAVFPSALTSSQVTTIYNSGTPDDLSTYFPTVWLRMGDDNGGTGSSVTNQGSTTTTNDGSLNNGATFSSTTP